MTVKNYEAPSPRPCESCPYRCDVPSGVWAASEYKKLPKYDLPTAQQPTAVFLCHQKDKKDANRLCGGWVGAHDVEQLLSLRLALAFTYLTDATMGKLIEYKSPVPLFSSGRQAAKHGMKKLDDPDAEATRIQGKILKNRSDILIGEG